MRYRYRWMHHNSDDEQSADEMLTAAGQEGWRVVYVWTHPARPPMTFWALLELAVPDSG